MLRRLSDPRGFVKRESRDLPAHSALPKQSSTAFLIADDRRACGPDFRCRKALAPLVPQWRAGVVATDRLQSDQYLGGARRFHGALRAHLGAGTKNSRAHPESLWAESGRTVRAFPADRR